MMTKNFEDAPEDVQDEMKALLRQAIRDGRFKFADECKEQMEKAGVSEDEIIGLLMQKVGLDS